MYAIQQEDILPHILTHTRGLTPPTKLHCMRNETYVHPTWPWSLMINFCSLCCAAAVSEGGFCKYPWTVFSARERIIGYRQDITIMSGYRQDITLMSGYRQDITIMSGYRQDTTIMSGYCQNITLMSGYRQDITLMSGYCQDITIMSGYRQNITMSGYRQDIMPGYHKNVRILK